MGLGGAEEVQASKKDAVALRHMAKKSSSEGGDLTAEQEKESRMCRSVTGPQAHQLVPGKFQPIAINQASHQTTRNLHQGRNNSVTQLPANRRWSPLCVSSRNGQNALHRHLHLDNSDPVLTSRSYSLYPT